MDKQYVIHIVLRQHRASSMYSEFEMVSCLITSLIVCVALVIMIPSFLLSLIRP